MQIFLEILDENLLIESLYENWWLQTSDTIRLALAASSIHKAAATEYCRRGGAERRTQRASRRHKPCVHAAPLPHAAPRGVPPPPPSTVAAAPNAAHSALRAAANHVRMPSRYRTPHPAARRAAADVETLGTVPIDDEGQIRPREPLGLYPHHWLCKRLKFHISA